MSGKLTCPSSSHCTKRITSILQITAFAPRRGKPSSQKNTQPIKPSSNMKQPSYGTDNRPALLPNNMSKTLSQGRVGLQASRTEHTERYAHQKIDQLIRHCLQNYWAEKPQAYLTDINFQAESLLTIQKRFRQHPLHE